MFAYKQEVPMLHLYILRSTINLYLDIKGYFSGNFSPFYLKIILFKLI